MTYTAQDFISYNGKNPTTRLSKEAEAFDPTLTNEVSLLLAGHYQEVDKTCYTQIPNLNPKFAKELIFNLDQYDSDNNTLTLGVTTGLMAKALQNVYQQEGTNHQPILVQGLIQSIDGYFALGVRGYPKERDPEEGGTLEPTDLMLMFTPAGYATFNTQGNLYTPAFKELKEEGGLTIEHLTNTPQMLGHHHDNTWAQGYRITFLFESNLERGEIDEKQNGASNAWEYRKHPGEDKALVWVPSNPNYINDLVQGNIPLKNLHSEARGLLEGVLKAPLLFYAEHGSFANK